MEIDKEFVKQAIDRYLPSYFALLPEGDQQHPLLQDGAEQDKGS